MRKLNSRNLKKIVIGYIQNSHSAHRLSSFPSLFAVFANANNQNRELRGPPVLLNYILFKITSLSAKECNWETRQQGGY